MQDRRITVWELADEVGVSIGSEIRAEAANKQLHLEIAQDTLECVESDSNFLNTVITGDESWDYVYDPETKAQTSQWKHSSSPRPKKARHVPSNVKDLLTVFLDPRGVVHHEYETQEKTVTKEYYDGVLYAFVMLWGANDRTCEQQKLGSSITTMHLPILRIWFNVFGLNTTFPRFVRLHTLPAWLLVSFGCSPNWKYRWEGLDLS